MVTEPPKSLIPAAKVLAPVFVPVSVRVRVPPFSHQLTMLARVKDTVASGVLPEASIVPPPPVVLRRIERFVLWAVEPA